MLLFHTSSDCDTGQELPDIHIISPCSAGRENITPMTIHFCEEFIECCFPFAYFSFVYVRISVENDLRTGEKESKECETNFCFGEEGKGIAIEEDSHEANQYTELGCLDE